VHGTRLMMPLLAIWMTTLLGWLYLRLQVHAIPHMKRYATVGLVVLMFLTGSVLSGRARCQWLAQYNHFAAHCDGHVRDAHANVWAHPYNHPLTSPNSRPTIGFTKAINGFSPLL
jgi:hypothetical protein